jgi:DNA-binding PadR family transcriptional regulator
MKNLATNDWAVLAFIAEDTAHGFKVASAFTKQQPLGNVWYLQRPQVYRSLEYLKKQALVQSLPQEKGESGPPRLRYQITKKGRQKLEVWLQTPVEHLREGRSELLLKLLFLQRRGNDTRIFLEHQKKVFQDIQDSLTERLNESGEHIIVLWRLHSVRAALQFIDKLL